MSKVLSPAAYSNNEVALLAWLLDDSVTDCVGFEITRLYLDTGEPPRVLAAWIPFEGQSNPAWKPQTTSVWPIQKLFWRDLTLRKRRDRLDLRPSEVRVQYLIRPLVRARRGLEQVTNIPPKTYKGNPIPLAYLDEGTCTNEILVTSHYGCVQATFTNGILAAQWLKSALQQSGDSLNA